MLKKISTYNLVMTAVWILVATMILSVIFCNLGYKGEDHLGEKEFTYYTRKSEKYDVEANLGYDYQSGSVVVATNLREYQEINKKYKIVRDKELTEKDFETSHYLYVIVGESACRDAFSFKDMVVMEKEVALHFTSSNCACTLSSLRTRAYEITVPKEVTNKTQFSLSFEEGDGLTKACDTNLK